FTRHSFIWGWATWKNRWNKMDIEVLGLSEYIESKHVKNICYDEYFKQYWLNQFKMAIDGKVDSWDLPWLFTGWKTESMTICPKRNLVSNIGFRTDATHTTIYDPLLADKKTYPVEFPLVHPTNKD